MANAMGWPSIYRPKTGGKRVQGGLTKQGSREFEKARAALAKLAKRPIAKVSDADTIEYLACGYGGVKHAL